MLHQKVSMRDESGHIVKWYGSSVEIEDRQRAEFKMSGSGFSFFAIDHPWNTELIDESSETLSPKSFLNWHRYGPALGQRSKYPLSFRRVFQTQL
jgi:hypothetical protein